MNQLTAPKPHILAVIVIAQFFCTSLWFAGNAVLPGLVQDLQLSASALGHISSAVQLGFISGTLCFALLSVADRFSPVKLFFISALAAAACNMGMLLGEGLGSLLSFRFFTGFFLAGIYPVGMKIAADHFDKGLGKALGWLVGALVLGTALPHLLKHYTTAFPWKIVIFLTSSLCIMGGVLLIAFVRNGSHRKPSQRLDLNAVFVSFKNKPFRGAAFGYFGHMWELYAFWTFLPLMIAYYSEGYCFGLDPSLYSFLVIGIGALSCIASGWLAQKYGAVRTAFTALSISGACCLLSPLAFLLPVIGFIAFLVVWGLAVTADSPVFSTLVAQNAPVDKRGTAITIVTCIGFSITIGSIELINALLGNINGRYIYMILGIGPVIGILYRLRSRSNDI